LSENRKILIVINPAAGKSSYKKRLSQLQKKLTRSEIKYELFLTEMKGEGKLSAHLLSNPHLNEVLVMGGDGTLNYVVNEIRGRQLPLSIVSVGTGNDSVKSIHGIMDVNKQIEIALHGKIGKFDLGVCNGRYFVNGVGIGFDGQVVKEMIESGNKRGRHIDYLMTVLRIIAGFKERPLRFIIDKESFEKTILLMTISNGTTFGGGFVINPNARPNDGKLDVCIFNELAPIKRFWHLPKLKTGTHSKIKETEFYQASEINIDSSQELVAHLDGEYIGHPPFKISLEKDAVSFRIPSGTV
jgi:YegS/Rv2252/BmrU family lipid kinase